MLDLKPFHLFAYRNENILINFEDMEVAVIDQRLAESLKNINSNSIPDSKDKIFEQLVNLDLVGQVPDNRKALDDISAADSTIIAATIFVTQNCNLNCTYCYGDGGSFGSSGNMKLKTAYDTVEWLIRQSKEKEMIFIALFGGEPFLNFNLVSKIVEYATSETKKQNKTVKFHITTNGTLLNDEIIDFIKEYEIHVSVSIDGPQEIHDAQRPFKNGKASFNAILPGVQQLLNVMQDSFGHAVVSDQTDPAIVEEALREIGFKEISYSMISASLFDENATIEPRDMAKAMQELEIEANKWVEYIERRNESGLKSILVRSQLYNPLMSLLYKNKRTDTCGAGRKNVAVSVKGDIYLCHRFVGIEDYKLGNVKNDQLVRDEYLKSPLNCIEKCRLCFAKYYCGGGCRHDNLGSCGSSSTPPEDMCKLRCKEFELAAYVFSRISRKDFMFLKENEVFPNPPCPIDF